MNAQKLLLVLAVLVLAACGGSSTGEIRATGAVTPKGLERATPTADKRPPTATPAATATTPLPTKPAEAPKATNTPMPPTEAPAPASRCQPASAGQLERIQAGVKGVAAGNEVRTAWAVKSGDFQNAWIVAAMVYGPGMEQGTGPGVWAINGPQDNPGLTLAVDGIAKEFSDWPDASKTDAAITLATDGVEAARQCAEAK